MEKLDFKTWYKRELNAIRFTYGELLREAKRNFPIHEAKKLYQEYLKEGQNVSRSTIK